MRCAQAAQALAFVATARWSLVAVLADMDDTEQEAAGPLGQRLPVHERPEVGAVPGDEQVRELVQQDVVQHPVRHALHPVGDADRARCRRARTPA